MVIPLHAKLSARAQNRVHTQTSKVKLILATNVAETSLTIEGVTTVINGGHERVLQVEGDEELLLTRINSKSTYHQRRGRCGRDDEGFFLNRGLPLHLLPDGYWDTQLLPLHKHFLKLLVADEDPLSLELPHDPGMNKRLESVAWLKRHGFTSADGLPTQLGVFAASLPIEPREAKAILHGIQYRDSDPELFSAIIDIATILSMRDFRQQGEEPLTKLVPSQLHYHMQRSEVLGNLCGFETIYSESKASTRSSLFRRFGVREAAAKEVLQLREEIADQLNFTITPAGQRTLWKLPADSLLEACAVPWSDHIYNYAGRDTNGDALYQNVADSSAPARRISRYADLGEPLLVTGKPFSLGLNVQINSEDDLLRLITQACILPRAWLTSNPKLQELEQRALECYNADLRSQRRQQSNQRMTRRSSGETSRRKGRGST
jgi:HrpA-like RNA helicase